MHPYSQEWLMLESDQSGPGREMNAVILSLAAAGALSSGCAAVPYDSGDERRPHGRNADVADLAGRRACGD